MAGFLAFGDPQPESEDQEQHGGKVEWHTDTCVLRLIESVRDQFRLPRIGRPRGSVNKATPRGRNGPVERTGRTPDADDDSAAHQHNVPLMEFGHVHSGPPLRTLPFRHDDDQAQQAARDEESSSRAASGLSSHDVPLAVNMPRLLRTVVGVILVCRPDEKRQHAVVLGRSTILPPSRTNQGWVHTSHQCGG